MKASPAKSIIVSAPSGSGKTSIVKRVLQALPELMFSVSATSRSPRAGERDGVDYHFLSASAFRQKIEQGDFLEWEEVYPGQFYGSLHGEVDRIWKMDRVAIFDLDVVGGANLKSAFGAQALAIFIQAPSLQELEIRLRNRGTESPESLATRISKAREEMEYASAFDRIIVNDDLERASEECIEAIRTFLSRK